MSAHDPQGQLLEALVRCAPAWIQVTPRMAAELAEVLPDMLQEMAEAGHGEIVLVYHGGKLVTVEHRKRRRVQEAA